MKPFTIQHGINVITNKKAALPLQDKTLRYFVLTSHYCGRPLATYLLTQGYENVIAPRRDQLDEDDIMAIIDTCDVFLLITHSAGFHSSPTPRQQSSPRSFNEACRDNADIVFFWYATSLGKTTIHLSLAPLSNEASGSGLVAATPTLQVSPDNLQATLMETLAKVLTADSTGPALQA